MNEFHATILFCLQGMVYLRGVNSFIWMVYFHRLMYLYKNSVGVFLPQTPCVCNSMVVCSRITCRIDVLVLGVHVFVRLISQGWTCWTLECVPSPLVHSHNPVLYVEYYNLEHGHTHVCEHATSSVVQPICMSKYFPTQVELKRRVYMFVDKNLLVIFRMIFRLEWKNLRQTNLLNEVILKRGWKEGNVLKAESDMVRWSDHEGIRYSGWMYQRNNLSYVQAGSKRRTQMRGWPGADFLTSAGRRHRIDVLKTHPGQHCNETSTTNVVLSLWSAP